MIRTVPGAAPQLAAGVPDGRTGGAVWLSSGTNVLYFNAYG
jgi:hypothetical protein